MRGWGRLLVWALGLAILGSLPVLINWSSLPDPVATHWGLDGTPNGHSPLWLAALLPAFVVAVGVLLALALQRDGNPSAEGVAVVGLVGGVGVWIGFSTMLLNVGNSTWEEASDFDVWQIIGVVIAALVLGWLGYVLGKRWYPPPPPAVRPVEAGPALRLDPEEVVDWVGSVSVRWPFYVLLPFGVLFLFLPGWFKGLAVVYVGLALLFARVTVEVGDDGLGVRLAGVLRVKRIPLDRIASCESIDLEPTEWAGWGYRVVPGGSAVVLRRGPAIVVHLVDDRRFAVTVDDADTGAALLNALVIRATAG